MAQLCDGWLPYNLPMQHASRVIDELKEMTRAADRNPDRLRICKIAEAGTGAKDFRDASFLPNLETTLEIPTRLNLSARGLMGVHANFTRFLVNRLRWEADVEKHPEIVEEDVSDPIIVLGLPRSGTIKHHMIRRRVLLGPTR